MDELIKATSGEEKQCYPLPKDYFEKYENLFKQVLEAIPAIREAVTHRMSAARFYIKWGRAEEALDYIDMISGVASR